MKHRARLPLAVPALAAAAALILASRSGAAPSGRGPNALLAGALAEFDAAAVSTGILYDRAVPLADMARFDGRPGAPPADAAAFRQLLFELRAASLGEPERWPAPEAARAAARDRAREGLIALGSLHARYQRLRPEALREGALELRDGRVVPAGGEPLAEGRLFAFAALRDYTYQGGAARFHLDPAWTALPALELDLDDGAGWRAARPGETVIARYAAPGAKILRARGRADDGSALEASARFDVRALMTPAPDDTLFVTAGQPYQGEAASGRGYVYLAPGHAELLNPVLVIEGFDLDDSMDWEELYALLNQQGLLESLRGEGFDAVVLDFAAATGPLQRNAYLIAELVAQVEAAIPPGSTMALVGASMGGLASRYALAWMETQGPPPAVRTFISFDAPHAGADIPLGIQYWLGFFADLSADAGYLLSLLDTPAARQMLVYHHTSPPAATGTPDSLRTVFEADLAAVGGWPSAARKVGVANGSGHGTGQGFAPRAQLIRWEYTSFLLDITGNIWAVPDGAPATTIFSGEIDPIFVPPTVQQVAVSGTAPYDGAPGGWRATMAQMDSTAAPYGDIVALHRNHSFIPTVSALAVSGAALFENLSLDPGLLARTPFDAIYYPAANEEHVTVTPASAEWFLEEVRGGATGVAAAGGSPGAAAGGRPTVGPNPAGNAAAVRFALARPGQVTLELFDAGGRRVARREETRGAGAGEIALDTSGLAAGAYFYRLRGAGRDAAGKLTIAR